MQPPRRRDAEEDAEKRKEEMSGHRRPTDWHRWSKL
jgi:hypothetical protein